MKTGIIKASKYIYTPCYLPMIYLCVKLTIIPECLAFRRIRQLNIKLLIWLASVLCQIFLCQDGFISNDDNDVLVGTSNFHISTMAFSYQDSIFIITDEAILTRVTKVHTDKPLVYRKRTDLLCVTC